MISAALALRTGGFPALDLWEVALTRLDKLDVMDGNQATMHFMKTGRNLALRHVSRTHGVSMYWLHDCYAHGLFAMT